MRVLMITSEWPSERRPQKATFVVQQVKFLRKAGIDVEVFSFYGNKNPVNYLRAWIGFRQQYDISAFDLIHAQFGQSGLIALPSRVPMVVTFHGSDLQGIVGAKGRYTISGLLLRRISTYVARRAKEVIVTSSRLLKHLPPGLSTHVVSGGVDLKLFYPVAQSEARKQLGLPKDKQLVLFVAYPHNPVKRFQLAQRAVGLLKEHLDVDLISARDVTHEEIPLYMNACDALIMTSMHEGSPTVVKEALACNLPIVSVDVGDVRSRIGDIEGCYVCDDDSPEAIASALSSALKRKGRIDAGGILKDIDGQAESEKIIEVYRLAIAKSRKGDNAL
ncbi:MAG: glycosyltransferase [Candidatus Omnitrophica bacterium]|nr:glycosyltransferase [Candidatus Omnitrophota bacterium]